MVRKDRVASSRMSRPSSYPATTRMGATVLGSMCLKTIRMSWAPRARAAVTYSRSRMANACALVMRANSTHPLTPTIRIRLFMSVPMSDAHTMAMRM